MPPAIITTFPATAGNWTTMPPNAGLEISYNTSLASPFGNHNLHSTCDSDILALVFGIAATILAVVSIALAYLQLRATRTGKDPSNQVELGLVHAGNNDGWTWQDISQPRDWTLHSAHSSQESLIPSEAFSRSMYINHQHSRL
jgi:hypothetical protein